MVIVKIKKNEIHRKGGGLTKFGDSNGSIDYITQPELRLIVNSNK